jgi:hypothetical protein
MVLEQLFKFGSNFRNLGATNQFPPNYYESTIKKHLLYSRCFECMV